MLGRLTVCLELDVDSLLRGPTMPYKVCRARGLGWLTGFLEAAEMRSPFFIIEVVLTSFGLLADGVFIEHLRIVCAAAAAGIPV